jgi:hypothetical protein
VNNFIFLVAVAALAMGHTSILEVSLQAQTALEAVCNLPTGNTTDGQITNQNANVAGPGNVNVTARGLAGAVAATAMTELGCAPNGVITSLFPSAGGLWIIFLDPRPTRELVPSSSWSSHSGKSNEH